MCYGSENCTILRMRSTMSAGERIEALDYGLRFFAEDGVNRKPQLLGLAAPDPRWPHREARAQAHELRSGP
jgi:hypothetical protein